MVPRTHLRTNNRYYYPSGYLQKKTVTNSFSFSSFANIFLFTSSISFFISNTSCDVNHDNTLSSSFKSPATIMSRSVLHTHPHCFSVWSTRPVVGFLMCLPSNISGTLFLKYTKDGKLMMLYFTATSGSDIFTISMPNKSASPSITSNSSKILAQSSQLSSSRHWFRLNGYLITDQYVSNTGFTI